MPTRSTAETGIHASLANFSRMIESAQALGAQYQPTNPGLQLPALTDLLNRSSAKVATVMTLHMPHLQAKGERAEKFAGLAKLSTRVVNAIAVMDGLPEGVLRDAKAINRKLQGNGNRKSGSNGDGGHSTTQRSYASRAAFLRSLIASVNAMPGYSPNEPELRPAHLTALADSLEAANQAVAQTYMVYSNALADRNKLINLPDTGLVAVAQTVKKYYKAAFGGNSPQYRQVSEIILTRIR